MNPLLQQLKDIHLPPSIPNWLIAPGWLVIYTVALGLFLYLIFYLLRKRKRQSTMRYALKQLKQIKQRMYDDKQNVNMVAEISMLIRRTALYYFSRNEIAGLSGQAWLRFLNNSGHTEQFTTEIGLLLIEAPYKKHNYDDLTPLFELTENWLKIIARKKRSK